MTTAEINRIKRATAQANHKKGLSGIRLSVVFGVAAVVGAMMGFVMLIKIAGL